MKAMGKVASSVAAIALSAALIAGSTFALFSSKADVNIAITSGKVDVKSTAELTSVYSALWSDDDNDYIKDNKTVTENVGTFSNGGTATYAGDTLTIENISPGDGVELTIKTENTSTIAIKYQTVVTYSGTEGDEGTALYRALNITVKGEDGMENISSDRSTASSEWTTVTEPNGKIKDVAVDIELPIDAGNTLQGKKCSLVVGIYAVQANGHDNTNQDVYFVNAASDLNEVVHLIEENGTLALAEEVTIDETNKFTIPEGRDITFDVNGKKMNVVKNAAEGQGFIVESGSSFTVTNSAEEGSFNLTASAEAENAGKRDAGNYTLRVENDSALEFKDVNVNISGNSGGDFVGYVKGTMNADKDTVIEIKGEKDNLTRGFNVRGGGEVNLNGATVESEGSTTQFVVGLGTDEVEGTLNLNAGTEIISQNCSYAINTLEAYPGGTINIHEGAKVTLQGDLSNNDPKSQKEQTATAVSVIGAGNVNMDGGEIVLAAKNGWAYAFSAMNNNFYDPEVQGGEKSVGIYLDAHIVLSGTAKVTANNQVNALFGMQKNGRQGYTYDEGGNLTANYKEAVFTEEPTLIIKATVVITINGVEINKKDIKFGLKQDDEFGRELGNYTPDAIQDERAISQEP